MPTVLNKLRLGGGLLLFSGTSLPTDGTTGRNKAKPGSLYIQTSTTGAANRIFINRGTKASPTWEQVSKVITVASLGRNGAGALTLAGTRIGDKVVMAYNLTDLTDSAAGFEATITAAGQIQQSSATDLSAKKHLFQIQR